MLAYSEACDSLVEVSVKGEVEEARRWQEEQGQQEPEEEEREEKETSQDDEGNTSKSRGKSTAKADAKKAKVLELHPLSVELAVKVEGADNRCCSWLYFHSCARLLLQFHLLPSLPLVTVRSTLGSQVRSS